jgi:hypothetical protein
LVRAQIATVLLGLPDPPSLSKGAPSRHEMIKLAGDLHWSLLLKADWDPDEHPRWPAGSADGKGGEFAPKGEGGEASASPISIGATAGRAGSRPDTRVQLADAGISDASNDPTAQAATRAAEAQRNASAQSKPADSEHEGFWQRLGSELSEETKALLAEIGRTQVERSKLDLAAATAAAAAIARTMRAYDEYRTQLQLGPDGKPRQVLALNPLAGLPGQLPLDPNGPVWRPATNADWLDPLANLLSLVPFVGPAARALRLTAPALEVVESAEVAAGSAAEAIETADVAAVSEEAAPYRATVGTARTNNYRKTF